MTNIKGGDYFIIVSSEFQMTLTITNFKDILNILGQYIQTTETSDLIEIIYKKVVI